MPGLLRGIARTAIISGTATAVSNRVSRRQAGRWAQQEQQEQADYQSSPAPAAPPAASGGADMSSAIDQLRDLAQLKEQGILTEAEFDAQKRRILGA